MLKRKRSQYNTKRQSVFRRVDRNVSINDLPDELIWLIFSFMDNPSDRVNVLLLQKRWAHYVKQYDLFEKSVFHRPLDFESISRIWNPPDLLPPNELGECGFNPCDSHNTKKFLIGVQQIASECGAYLTGRIVTVAFRQALTKKPWNAFNICSFWRRCETLDGRHTIDALDWTKYYRYFPGCRPLSIITCAKSLEMLINRLGRYYFVEPHLKRLTAIRKEARKTPDTCAFYGVQFFLSKEYPPLTVFTLGILEEEHSTMTVDHAMKMYSTTDMLISTSELVAHNGKKFIFDRSALKRGAYTTNPNVCVPLVRDLFKVESKRCNITNRPILRIPTQKISKIACLMLWTMNNNINEGVNISRLTGVLADMVNVYNLCLDFTLSTYMSLCKIEIHHTGHILTSESIYVNKKLCFYLFDN